MMPDQQELYAILSQAAQAELLPRFRRVGSNTKDDGSLVTEADIAMQNAVRQELAKTSPEYVLLGEEMSDQEQRAIMSRPDATFWCLDPLDGTTNYAVGVAFFAVSLALIVNRQVVMGAIYDPIRDEFFYARRGAGAYLNNVRLSAISARSSVPLKQGVGIVDFKRLSPKLATQLATQPPFASQRSFGSVALDWCWLAAGRGHVYVHGKQKIWDFAAGWLILDEAGGKSATLDNEPVFDGSFSPRSAVAALDNDVFLQWQTWLQQHS